MRWGPLKDAYSILVKRGMPDGDAREALTSAISTFGLLIKPHRQYDRQYGPSWIANPNIDFSAGTIALPLVRVQNGLPSWDDLPSYRRLTHVLVDIDLDQFESLWPAAENPMKALKPKRGRPFEYDWSEAEAFAHDVMAKRGDPTACDQVDGFKTVTDLARLIATHLSKGLPDKEPDFGLTREKATSFIESWQAKQRELIGKD
jgi:hypothetical protein